MEQSGNVPQKKKGLSGSTLKLIAIVTMFIDHAAAAVLLRVLLSKGVVQELYTAYWVMRYIGRIAFPIFCFQLVEGFDRTRSLKKYILRMALFALATEIPFDLAFAGRPVYWRYQNVMFTLLIGLLTMLGFSLVEKTKLHIVLKVLCAGLILAAGAGAAELMHTDYGAIGILCIMVLYVLRRKKILQILGGCISFAWEYTAPLAFIFIGLYNGKRGWRMKYFFYAFYPVHLLFLYLVCVLMGTAGISTI